MKKVFLTLFAVLLAVPAFAVEVYNNGDNSVGIYGHVRGYMGYGMGMSGGSADNNGTVTTVDPTFGHQMFYGVQGNTRIGTNIKLGNFTAQFELGANEKTLVNGAKDTVGLRQAWAAYTFGNGSRLLVGKTDTPTAMSGFNSSIYDTDGGLNGFGGSPTGFRRFQVQYSIAGLTLALIEDDAANASMKADDGTGTQVSTFTDNAPYTPRAGISYVFKNDALLAKIAATYTAVNGYYTDKNNKEAWTNLHAFGVALGVKPTFGNMWVGVHARYGMNEDLYGEGGTYYNNGSFGHTNLSKWDGTGMYNATLNSAKDGSFNNIHRAGAAVEFGMKATESFTFIVGGGYQATIPELEEVAGVEQSHLVHSYAVFLQGQYAFNQNFALVPEIAWFGTVDTVSQTAGGVTDKSSNYLNGLLVGLQFRANF